MTIQFAMAMPCCTQDFDLLFFVVFLVCLSKGGWQKPGGTNEWDLPIQQSDKASSHIYGSIYICISICTMFVRTRWMQPTNSVIWPPQQPLSLSYMLMLYIELPPGGSRARTLSCMPGAAKSWE